MPEETRRRTGVVLSRTSFAFENGVVVVAREDVPNDAKEEERQHDDEWVRLRSERISVQLSGIAVSTVHGNLLETETRPSAVFGFDDLNASLGGLCSLVLRLWWMTRKVRDNWEERGGEGG